MVSEYEKNEKGCPDPYYVIGIVGKEFDHRLLPNEKEVKEFYQKPGRNLIKSWKMDNINNGLKFAERYCRIYDICKELIREVKKSGLSIEELIKKLPNKV